MSRHLQAVKICKNHPTPKIQSNKKINTILSSDRINDRPQARQQPPCMLPMVFSLQSRIVAWNLAMTVAFRLLCPSRAIHLFMYFGRMFPQDCLACLCGRRMPHMETMHHASGVLMPSQSFYLKAQIPTGDHSALCLSRVLLFAGVEFSLSEIFTPNIPPYFLWSLVFGIAHKQYCIS